MTGYESYESEIIWRCLRGCCTRLSPSFQQSFFVHWSSKVLVVFTFVEQLGPEIAAQVARVHHFNHLQSILRTRRGMTRHYLFIVCYCPPPLAVASWHYSQEACVQTPTQYYCNLISYQTAPHAVHIFVAHCPAICRLDFGKLWAAGIIFCAAFDLPHTGVQFGTFSAAQKSKAPSTESTEAAAGFR